MNQLSTLLDATTLIGKVATCIKKDLMDDRCNIPDDKRWNVDDTIIIAKIEVLPWGTFLYDNQGHNLNIRRAQLVE